MSKYLEVEIENFQSIKKQIFVFKSLTSIVGPTDRGKSAVFRALKAVLYNEWEEGFLRRGAKLCTIIIKFPDQYPIREIIKERGKGGGKNSYTFKFRDGRKDKHIPKAGTKIPDEIKALGFEIVETERGDKFNLNFHEQYDPLFMVAQPEPLVTSFINKIFKITLYERALKKLTADQIKLNREYEDNEIVLKNKENELEGVKRDFFNTSQTLDQVEELISSYDLCQEEINRYDKGIESLNTLDFIGKECNLLKSEFEKIFNIGVTFKTYKDRFQEYCNLVNNLDNLILVDAEYNRLSLNSNKLENYKNLIENYFSIFNDYKDLVNIVDSVSISGKEIEEISFLGDRLSKIQMVLNKYYLDFQSFFNFNNSYNILINLNLNIDSIKKEISNCRGVLQYLDAILAYEQDLNSIFEAEAALISLDKGIESCVVNFDKVNGDYKKIIEYENFVKSIVKQCPVCDSLLEV